MGLSATAGRPAASLAARRAADGPVSVMIRVLVGVVMRELVRFPEVNTDLPKIYGGLEVCWHSGHTSENMHAELDTHTR